MKFSIIFFLCALWDQYGLEQADLFGVRGKNNLTQFSMAVG